MGECRRTTTATTILLHEVVLSLEIETNQDDNKNCNFLACLAYFCVPCLLNWMHASGCVCVRECLCKCVRKRDRERGCTIWLYYFCSAHNLLNEVCLHLVKYYDEVIERQRPKLWLKWLADEWSVGRTDRQSYGRTNLTKIVWLIIWLVSCFALCADSCKQPTNKQTWVLGMATRQASLCGQVVPKSCSCVGRTWLLITMINC